MTIPEQRSVHSKSSLRAKSATSRPWITFVVIFCALFLCLDYSYRYVIGTWGQRLLIDHLTIPAATYLIHLFMHGALASSSGHSIVFPTGSIIVNPGCEGTEGMFLIVAAVIAIRAGWTHTMVGIVGGILLMYVLNLLRLVGFYFVLKQHPAWFLPLHDLIGPTFIIAAGFLFFVAWMNTAIRTRD